MQKLIEHERGLVRLPVVVTFSDDSTDNDTARKTIDRTQLCLQTIADAESFEDTPPPHFEIETDPGGITCFKATVPSGSRVKFFRINTKTCAPYDRSFIEIKTGGKVVVRRAEFGLGKIPSDTETLDTEATAFVVEMSAPYARTRGCCTSHGVAIFEAWGRTRKMEQAQNDKQHPPSNVASAQKYVLPTPCVRKGICFQRAITRPCGCGSLICHARMLGTPHTYTCKTCHVACPCL